MSMYTSNLEERPLSQVKEKFNVTVSDVASILEAGDEAVWTAGSKAESYRGDSFEFPNEVFAGPTEMKPKDAYNRLRQMDNANASHYERDHDKFDLHKGVLNTEEGEQPFLIPACRMAYNSIDFDFLSEDEARITVEVDSYGDEFYEVYHVSGEGLAENLGVEVDNSDI